MVDEAMEMLAQAHEVVAKTVETMQVSEMTSDERALMREQLLLLMGRVDGALDMLGEEGRRPVAVA